MKINDVTNLAMANQYADMKKIWGWADEYHLPDSIIPRNRKELLQITDIVIPSSYFEYNIYLPMALELLPNFESVSFSDIDEVILNIVFRSINDMGEIKLFDSNHLIEETLVTDTHLSLNSPSHLPKWLRLLKCVHRVNIDYYYSESIFTKLNSLNNIDSIILSDVKRFDEDYPLIKSLKNLKGINFWNSESKPFLDKVCELHQLTYLYSCDFNIDTISDGIACLNYLTVLGFDNAGLIELNSNIGTLKHLTDLQLFDNKLTKLPESMSELEKLQTIHLDNNQLSNLPSCFDSLENLVAFTARDNLFTFFPKPLLRLNTLKTLTIGNDIKNIPEEINTLNQLETLEVIGSFSSIPASLFEISSLKRLTLKSRNLQTIPKGLSKLVNLEFLSIKADTPLLSDDIFSLLPNLKEIGY